MEPTTPTPGSSQPAPATTTPPVGATPPSTATPDPTPTRPAPPPTEAPDPQPPAIDARYVVEGYPHSQRTGVPPVDRLIDAAIALEVDTLVDLAVLERQPCHSNNDYIPRCPDGDEFTEPLFTTASCHGNFWPASDLPRGFAVWLDVDEPDDRGLTLHSVHAIPPRPEAALRSGFLVRFVDARSASLWFRLDERGGILELGTGCGPLPPALGSVADGGWILPPRGLRYYPPDARSGVAEVDRVLALVHTRDDAGLTALASLRRVECLDQVPYAFPCPPDADEGTSFDAFNFNRCHGEWATADNLQETLLDFLTDPGGPYFGVPIPGPLRLHSVAGPVDDSARFLAYTIELAFADGRARSIELSSDGRVSSVRFGCLDGNEPLGELANGQ